MKIALTGAGGTGKGTLGKALAETLQVPFLPSGIKETGSFFFGMESYKDISKEKEEVFQYTILANQIGQERAAGLISCSYVAERSTLDYILYYVQRGLTDKNYIDKAIEWATNYDLILYTPADDFVPADKGTNSWRQRDLDERIETDRILKSYLQMFDNVVTITGDPEKRLTEAFNAAMYYKIANVSPILFSTTK